MAAPTHVTFSGASGAATTTVAVTILGVTSGHSLIGGIGVTAAATPVLTITDDRSNTWVSNDVKNTATRTAQIGHCVSAAAGDTVITATSDTSTGFFFGVSQVNFGGTTCTLDVTGTDSNAAATTHNCATSGNIDTTTDVYVMAVGASGTSYGGGTPASGFTELFDSAGRYIQYESTATALTDDRAAFTSVSAVNSGCCVASFKGVSSATNNNNLLLLGVG